MSAERCDPAAGDCYAVMGNPIAHSKSPQIHRLFAEQTGQRLGYDAILVAIDGFSDAVQRFAEAGGRGLNVTVPFKQEAWARADTLSERAQRAGAANTLSIAAHGRIEGDNTDGVGLVRDLLDNLEVDLGGRTILLLGAGGAARGVLAPLLQQQPSSLHIANRTVSRASDLCTAFSDLGPLSAGGFDALAGRRFDVIINATAASLDDAVPALPEGVVDAQSACYDMMYARAPTAFMRYARECGCTHAYDGLGMLVEQAAESFRIWRGIVPDTAPVIAALRESA